MMQPVADSLARPTVLIMPARYWELQASIDGLAKIQTPLVAAIQTDSGTTYRALGTTDDAGLYYFLPKLAQIFHLSLNEAWTLWFFGILAIAVAVGIYGMMRYLQSPLVKALYLIQLVGFAALVIKIGDIHELAPCLTIAILPFALRFLSEPIDDKKFLRSVGLFGLLGVLFGLAHSIRSHSATALLLFISTLIFFASTLALNKRLVLILSLVIGFLLPQFYMKTVLDTRDEFLKAHQPTYTAALRQHPFWHTVYIGFGFLSNDYGILYKDEVAAAKVRSVAPEAEYCSPQYETVLKNETLNLVKSDFALVFFTIAAKLGVIGMYLILFANVGLLAALRYPKRWSIELAFFAALSFNALFGVLAMPRLSYLTGFLAVAWLYGIVSLDEAIRQRRETLSASVQER